MKPLLKTFMAGYMQVFLYSISTLAIAHKVYALAFVVSYLIGWLWQSNVKRTGAATRAQLHIYNLGSACGTITGIGLVSLFLK